MAGFLGILLYQYHVAQIKAVRFEEQEACYQLLIDMEEGYLSDIEILKDSINMMRKYISQLYSELYQEKEKRYRERRAAAEKLTNAIQQGEEKLQIQLQQFKVIIAERDSIHHEIVKDERLAYQLTADSLQFRIDELEDATNRQSAVIEAGMPKVTNWNDLLKLALYVGGMILAATVLSAASQRFTRRR